MRVNEGMDRSVIKTVKKSNYGGLGCSGRIRELGHEADYGSGEGIRRERGKRGSVRMI